MVFGVLLYILSISLTSVTLWLLNISIPLVLISAFSSLLAVGAAATRQSKNISKTSSLFDSKDVVSLLVVAAFVGLLGVGIIRTADNNTSPKTILVQMVAYGVDDLTHQTMVQDTLTANSGLLLGSRSKAAISKVDSIPYPKMAHLVAAVLISLADRTNASTPSKTTFLLVYSSIKLILFIVAIYVISRTALELQATAGVSTLALVAVATPLLGFIIFSFVSSLIQEGFFSVWPVLIFLPLSLLLIRDLNKHTETTNTVLLSLCLLILLMSWPLVAVPLCVVIGLLFIHRIIVNPKRPKTYLLILLPATIALLGASQLYVQLFDKGSGIETSQLNASGGILLFPMLYLVIFTTLAFYSILEFYKNKPDRNGLYNRDLSLLFVGSFLGLLLLIGGSNIVSSGTLQYFFIKTAYLFLMVVSLLSFPLVANRLYAYFDNTNENQYTQAVIALVTSTSLVLVSFFAFNMPGVYVKYTAGYFLAGERHVSSQAAREIVNAKGLTAVIDADSVDLSYFLSTAMRSVNNFDYCLGDIHSFISNPATDRDLPACHPNTTLALVIVNDPKLKDQVSDATIKELSAKLTSRGVKNTVTKSANK